MRSKRTPDRVHVVKPPEQQNARPAQRSAQRTAESREIVQMLAQISDKLKRSEAERYKLLSELRDTRETVDVLKNKADQSEQAYQDLESRIQHRGDDEASFSERQARFEKTLQATEEKMVKAIAGQALIDKRLHDTEEKQMMIHQQIEKSMDEQKKLEHQIEINIQDKSRLLRKMERLEEMMTDTQDTLRAKAMVLLTDKGTANQAPNQVQAPAWGQGSPDIRSDEDRATFAALPWAKFVNWQTAGIASVIAAAVIAGWAISQLQKSSPDQESSLEIQTSTNFDAQTQTDTDVSDIARFETPATPQFDVPGVEEVSAIVTPLPEDVMEYSDEQLLSAMNTDPDALASKLNDIEPAAVPEETVDIEEQTQQEEKLVVQEEPKPEPESKSAFSSLDMSVSDPIKNFEGVAYRQQVGVRNQIEEALESALSLKQFSADSALPAAVKKIESQAFLGNANAQHDLAAIYTAGHGGVAQNFEKANYWFLKAAEKNVANAQYNLGVLNHQGLGTERNLDKALYWYREAAKRGHAEAQYNLGISHIEGIGTDYDPKIAAGFFERAANSGIVEAAYNLGLIYENGLLGDVKLEEAMLWYNIAAKQGNLEAQKAMEQIAKQLQIGTEDIDKFVERMQKINESAKGRRAGPDLGKNVQSRLESSKAVTAQIQDYLILSGKYKGPADGISGPGTGAAGRRSGGGGRGGGGRGG
ncbi:MAG: hypothetical protein AAF244_03655, partial [Pseudomonadota bacterium]